MLDFVLVDKSFSLREIIQLNKEMAPYVSQMNTNTVGMLIPELLEEYGADRKVDLMFTTSHALISPKLPDAKVSGF